MATRFASIPPTDPSFDLPVRVPSFGTKQSSTLLVRKKINTSARHWLSLPANPTQNPVQICTLISSKILLFYEKDVFLRFFNNKLNSAVCSLIFEKVGLCRQIFDELALPFGRRVCFKNFLIFREIFDSNRLLPMSEMLFANTS